MTDRDRYIIQHCLNAIASEVFVDGDEFEVITGVPFANFKAVQGAYPDVDDDHDTVALAINGALGNLLGYPHGRERRWNEFIPVSREDVEDVYTRWRCLKGWQRS